MPKDDPEPDSGGDFSLGKGLIKKNFEQKAKTDIMDRKDQTALMLTINGNSQSPSASCSRTGLSPDRRDSASVENRSMVKYTKKNLKRKTITGDENNQNRKKVSFRTAEEAEEEISCEEDLQFNDGIDDKAIPVRRRTSQFNKNDKYASSGLKHTLHGNIYQLKLLMLFLKRGLRKGYSFRLATEMDAAEKFDDLVFQYEINTKNATAYRFLQAKHKQNENETISASDLLTERDDEFSLQKYFISYCKMKKHSELSKSTFKDFIICTNINFDFKGLESKNIRVEKVDSHDPFLTGIKNSKKQAARYKFLVDEESVLHKTLKKASDVHKLAKMLVEHVYGSKDITLRNDLFKLYHAALGKEVINVKTKQFYDEFIKGESRCSDGAKKFRKIFLAEAKQQLEKSLKQNISDEQVIAEITKNQLKLSSTFGQRFELCTDPTLNSLKEFSEELVELINSASDENVVTVNRKKYRKKAKAGSRVRVFVDNIDKLAGHVLIADCEKKTIKFRSQFFDDNIKLPGNLEDLKKLLKDRLGSKYDDLGRYQFKMNSFQTCEEEQLYSKTEMPADDADGDEIIEFFDKLIFAVNQPDEIELGHVIAREIAADSQFNLLDADLVSDSFQKEMLDWFKEKGKEKGKEGRFYSAMEGKAFFDSLEQKVNTLISSGLILTYLKELENYKIAFNNKNDALEKFLSRDSDYSANPVLNLIAAQETLPTAIRVQDAVKRTGKYEENDSSMFLRLRTSLLPRIKERVITAFGSPRSHHLLVIDCESAERQELQGLYHELWQTMRKTVGKKLILVTRENESSDNQSSMRLINCYETHDDVRFNDLTTKSRHQLMDRPIINFQGRRGSTSFGQLLGICASNGNVTQKLTNFGSIIDRSTLVKLIRQEEIEIGNDLRGLADIEKYYINRLIKQQIIIKDDIFESQSKSDVIVISVVDGQSSLNPQEQSKNKFHILKPGREVEEFKALCEKSVNNVHWLKLEGGKLIWQQSRGNIFSLLKHRAGTELPYESDSDTDKITDIYSTEDDLADPDNQQKIVIISDCAGMGKTTLLTNLATRMKKKEPGLWVIKIDLNDFTTVLDKELKTRSFNARDRSGAIKFFVEKLSNIKTDLEKKILTTIIENGGRVALLFDGFDEISPDYKNVVADSLKAVKAIGVTKLFVATRPEMRETLENELGIFSYTMQPFSPENQIEFLVQFWKASSSLEGIEHQIEPLLKTCAQALIKKVVESIDDTVKDLISIPLQTRMIAEVYQSDAENKVKRFVTCNKILRSKNYERKLPNKLTIVDLYEKFVEKKYKIYCVEKRKTDLANLGAREDEKVLKDRFLIRHEGASFLHLFGPRDLRLFFNQQEIKTINAFKTQIIKGKERTGIMTQVINSKPQFIHRTFAEYFVAKRLIHTLLLKANHDDSKLREFTIVKILYDRYSMYKLTRTFLNHLLLKKSSQPARQQLSTSANEAWRNDFSALNQKYRCSVFKTAVREGHCAIVKFFVNRFDNETCNDLINLRYSNGKTLLHTAAENRHWTVLKWLVEKGGAKVNVSDHTSRHWTPLHDVASHGNLDIVKWLAKKGALGTLNDLSKMSLLRAAAHDRSINVLKWLVDEKKVKITCRPNFGQTLLNYAAKMGQLKVVKWLADSKNMDVNIKKYGKKILRQAIASNDDQWNVAKWLIMDTEEGADIAVKFRDEFRDTVLHKAAFAREWGVVKWLVEHKNADVKLKNLHSKSALQIAASNGGFDLVKWLWKKKCIGVHDFDGEALLCHAAISRNRHLVEWLVQVGRANVNIQDPSGMTVLHFADPHSQFDLIRWLVQDKGANADIQDVKGITFLHLATAAGHFELVKWLVEERGFDISIKSYSDMTLLHYAAECGEIPLVKWLLEEKGADIDAKTSRGETVLFVAALWMKWDLVEWLIKEKGIQTNCIGGLLYAIHLSDLDSIKRHVNDNGIDLHAKLRNRDSILYRAFVAGHSKVIKWLVDEMGVNPNNDHMYGSTLLNVAIMEGPSDVREWAENERANNMMT